uniref:Uncharacterized protein n=1 Tax=Arundo donax TaxID=35708 RepID=A0A0A9DFT1_ARUDO
MLALCRATALLAMQPRRPLRAGTLPCARIRVCRTCEQSGEFDWVREVEG